MNRIASLLAGSVTTAFVGASVAAVSASQGVLPGWGSSAPADAGWAETTQSTEDAWAGVEVSSVESAPETAPTTTVIYVDKEPIVITKEIVVRSQAPAPVATPESRGLSAPTPEPSGQAAPPPVADGGGDPQTPTTFSGSAPAPAAPTGAPATPPTVAPPPSSPVGTLASSGSPGTSGWDDDDSEDEEDREDEDDEDEEEDEPEYEDEHEEEDD